MTILEHLKRARGLLAAGRFQRQVIQRIDHLKPIEAQSSEIEGLTYLPYFDSVKEQLTFLRQTHSKAIYEQLYFANFDYHYGTQDGIVWVDRDEE